MKPFLTIAIPTMRRWIFLKNSLPGFLKRPEVAEVIICDETGEDISEIMKSNLSRNPKLRCIQNDRILGIYENKRKCISMAKTEWVALLDSDNYFQDDWFDIISNIDQKDLTKIYASADFKTVNAEEGSVLQNCTQFSGLTLSLDNWNSMLTTPGWNFLLNDGNWVLPKKCLNLLPITTKSNDLLAVDALYMLRCFVKGGLSVYYIPDLSYIHMVHNGSSWIKTEARSTTIMNDTDWNL